MIKQTKYSEENTTQEDRVDLVLKEVSHDFAKNLRKNSTYSEKIFWESLRNRKLMGKKFLRQYPIKLNPDGNKNFFIADFYCHEARLIIELDSEIHDLRKEYDDLRDEIISNLNITVLRFKNEEIEDNIEVVLKKIKNYFLLQAPPLKINSQNIK